MANNSGNWLNPYPSLRLALFVLPGIAAGIAVSPDLTILIYLLSAFILIAIACLFIKYYFVSYLFAGIAIGFYISFFAFDRDIDYPKKIIPEMKGLFRGEIKKILKNDGNKYAVCVAEGSLDTKDMPPLNGQVIILQLANVFELPFDLEEGLKIFSPVIARVPRKSILPGEPDESKFAGAFNAVWVARTKAENISLEGEPNKFSLLKYRIANAINIQIDALYNGNAREVAKAMLTGERSGIPRDLKNAYSVSGTAHVLSISGLHVGIIAFIIYFFLNFIGRQWLKFILFVVLTAAFVIITGVQPPALRAGVMASVFVFAVTIQRKANLLNVLFFTGLVMIVFDPPLLRSLSFQLSFLSILGIALFYPVIKQKIYAVFPKQGALASRIADSASLGIAVSVAISLVLSLNFGYFSLISLIANLAIVPLMMGGLVFNVISLMASIVSFDIALIYSAVSGFLIDLSNNLVLIISKLDFMVFTGNNAVVFAVLFPLMAFYAITSKNRKAFIFKAVIVVILFLSVNILIPDTARTTYSLKVYPRSHLVAAEKALDDSLTLFYLADRRPARYFYKDNRLLEYMLDKKGRLVLATSGRISGRIADSVSTARNCRHIVLNYNSEEYLSNLLNLNSKLYRIIEIDNE